MPDESRIVRKGLFRASMACFMALGCVAVAAAPLPVELFASGPEYRDIKISPNGDFLAVIAPVDGQDSLIVIDFNEMAITGTLRFARGQEVLNYAWVNEDRVVCSLGRTYAGKGEITYTAGELFAMDADGGNKQMIFGQSAGADSAVDTRIRQAKPMRALGWLIDPLPDDRRNALIGTIPFGFDGYLEDVAPTLFELNVYSGARKKSGPVPYGVSGYLLSAKGAVHGGTGRSAENHRLIYFREDGKSDMQVLDDISQPSADAIPLALHPDGKRIYLAASQDGAPRALALYDPATKSQDILWQNETYDVDDVLLSADRTTAVGLRYYADKWTYAWFDKQHAMARTVASIQHAFKENEVSIASQTQDGKRFIVRVGGAHQPDDFYYYDSDERRLEKVLGSRKWLDPALMARARSVEIPARDGTTLRGYVTTPNDSDGKNLPLVVMPHGGPHGVRDRYGFDPDVQVVANNGYAVLQVDFRGSHGYGPAFQSAGFRNWGELIQDDISDATRWAIEQGVADPERVCILGASFGAYSALMSAIREPELYRCAVAHAGVYDLPMMFDEGDIADLRYGPAYLRDVLGTDMDRLRSQSPAFNADAISAALLISYGKLDERAPPKQSLALTKALDAAHKPYELLEMRDEGHSLINPATTAEYYRTVIAFLDRHIGSRDE